MTIEEGGVGPQQGGEDRGRRRKAAAHELRRYEDLFAARTRVMRSSAMRDMMALTERPEVISLAAGTPDTRSFPGELFAALMSRIAAESSERALQYGPTEGLTGARESVVEVMAAEGTHVMAEDLIITTGGQQVIDLICKTLIDPGDVILAEAPTYPGALSTFAAYQAEVRQIGMDAEGMPMDELEQALDDLAAAGCRPKFIYTIPNFQNPGGVTMSLARRRRLVDVARERELLVLEDNPYGLLRYEGTPLPTLYSLDASTAGKGGASDFVMYLGTFSKIFSPGLRTGWAVAPRPVLEKLNLCKQGTDLCSSSVIQLFVAAYFSERDHTGAPAWLAYLETLRGIYRRRRDVMNEALEQHLGEVAKWTRPEGGMFVWVTLPDYIDTTDLLARALESEGVAFVPGRGAYADGRGGSSMRLNFAGIPDEDIREAIKRIGRVVRRQVGLFGTFTGSSAPVGGADRPTRVLGGDVPELDEVPQEGAAETEGADILQLPSRDERRRARRGGDA